MANRKILYGYQILHGDLVIQEEERLTVQNVFTTYLAGLSYQALADRMNADNIPFSQESPLWNKHKIKRMLENSRYAGENGYPPIIDQDTFQQVQKKIAEKTSGKLPRRTESDPLMAKAAKRMLSGPSAPDRRANRAYWKSPSEMFCLQKRICCREGGTACADGTAACGT